MVNLAPRCRYVATTFNVRMCESVAAKMHGGRSLSNMVVRHRFAPRPLNMTTPSDFPLSKFMVMPCERKVLCKTTTTASMSEGICSGSSVANGIARSSTQERGGTWIPSLAHPWEYCGNAWSSASIWCIILAMRRLKPMSANGDPGLVPRSVTTTWSESASSWNHVDLWRSCKKVRRAAGMSVGSVWLASRKSSASFSMSNSLGSRMRSSVCRAKGSRTVNMYSRSMWWKAAFRSTKITAVVIPFWRPTLPCSFKIWMAVTVCCDGSPPNWPGTRRCISVGSNLERAHACSTFPKQSARRIPLYELGSWREFFCFQIGQSCPPLYRCGSMPCMKAFSTRLCWGQSLKLLGDKLQAGCHPSLALDGSVVSGRDLQSQRGLGDLPNWKSRRKRLLQGLVGCVQCKH